VRGSKLGLRFIWGTLLALVSQPWHGTRQPDSCGDFAVSLRGV
jgi:hypothetical protein